MTKRDKKLHEIRTNLLSAISAAMEVHEELIPDHGKYESFLEELVPQTNGFSVDRTKLRSFEEVLYFMLIGTFGVDGSDGKSQANVVAHLTDRQRYPSPNFIELPYLHKIREHDQIVWADILRKANRKVSSAMSELDHVNSIIESEMRARGAAERRVLRSRGCTNPVCRKGLVQAGFKAREAFKTSCTEFQRMHLSNEPYPGGGYYILCDVCQTPERQAELDAEAEQ
ncbi:MAG: hypothetical protein AB7L09_03370 [Nitrospira sp.]